MTTTKRTALLGLAFLALAALTIVACAGGTANQPPPTNGGDTDTPTATSDGNRPFSITATVKGATVAEVTAALATYFHEVNDSEHGLPHDWILAGGDQLGDDDEPLEAALRLPDGSRIVEVCNRHYATMALSHGGHRAVALPCEIGVIQQGDDVEVILLEPEAIFGLFFTDLTAEAAEEMRGVPAAVRAELMSLIEAGLQSLETQQRDEPVGPLWDDAALAALADQQRSIAVDIDIPASHRESDEQRQAFRTLFVERLLATLTHEGMERVGSQVSGLSANDWRSARTYALTLPGGVSVVEACSPAFARAALSTGTYHAPALPCEIAVYVDGDTLRVHILAPLFIFAVFFGDAPPEQQEQLRAMAESVQQDLTLIVTAARDAALTP